jgi:predicted lipoprotein with Yx(FWY)xxD motif
MRRFIPLVLAVAAAAVVATQAYSSMMSPVTVQKTAKFGKILANEKHLALYTWTKEKDLKVHCTGACAKLWPPLLVARGEAVPKHVPGAMGTFGVVMRPDGSHQVTWDRRPLYTFSKDTPTKILCNGVQGWYVVKA